MPSLVSRLLRAVSPSSAAGEERGWAAPEGRRVYAIGDVHGRFDLLTRLIKEIDRDDAERAPARTTLVMLGDLVDRGPDSRRVIELLMAYAASGADCVFLAGNHDEVLTRAIDGEPGATARLHQMGGRETALSYGVTPEEYDRGSFDDLSALLRARVPAEHVSFLRSMKDWHQIGDYVFVHAGVRPGLPMSGQKPSDLRWIRQDFLEHDGDHGAMIVHGHTVFEEPQLRSNRIGIDTGAFRTGRLTALGLQNTDRWLLST